MFEHFPWHWVLLGTQFFQEMMRGVPRAKLRRERFSKISIRVRWYAMNYNFMVYCCSWKHYVKVLVAALLILQTLLNYKLLKSKASPSRGRELLDYYVDGSARTLSRNIMCALNVCE
jgi:hypothetical protein